MAKSEGKQWICDALLALAQNRSAADISITELIHKAGVSRNTFYYHFTGTQAVLEYMMDDFLSEYLEAISIPAGETAQELSAESQIELERKVCGYIAGTGKYVQFFLREDNYRLFCTRFSDAYRAYCDAHVIVQIFPDGHREPLRHGMVYDYYVHMSCLQLFAVLECWARCNFSETEEDFIQIFNTLHTTRITFQGKA